MGKNKDEFMTDRRIGYVQDFEYYFSVYKSNKERMDKLNKFKSVLLSEFDNVSEVAKVLDIESYTVSYNYVLAYKRLAQIYNLLSNLVEELPDPSNYKGTNVTKLLDWISNYDKTKKYTYALDDLEQCYKTEKYTVDKITFPYNCEEGHKFVREDGELRCVNCGFTTKDYDFDEEQLDYLTFCAEKKGLLLEEKEKNPVKQKV